MGESNRALYAWKNRDADTLCCPDQDSFVKMQIQELRDMTQHCLTHKQHLTESLRSIEEYGDMLTMDVAGIVCDRLLIKDTCVKAYDTIAPRLQRMIEKWRRMQTNLKAFEKELSEDVKMLNVFTSDLDIISYK